MSRADCAPPPHACAGLSEAFYILVHCMAQWGPAIGDDDFRFYPFSRFNRGREG